MEQEILRKLIIDLGEDYEESDREVLLLHIEDAFEAVMTEAYPWMINTDSERERIKNVVYKRYGSIIRKIALGQFQRRGVEDEVSHSENGTSISYENAGIPSSYLRQIVPIARIV